MNYRGFFTIFVVVCSTTPNMRPLAAVTDRAISLYSAGIEKTTATGIRMGSFTVLPYGTECYKKRLVGSVGCSSTLTSSLWKQFSH